MSVFRHPLHLAAIVAGLVGAAAGVWMASTFVGATGLLLATTTAVRLARSLGLEPADDPAAPSRKKA
ncbi:MAG: hypothetical protein K2X61_14640 [Caulobacteraceae bacterium]|nr:hypothetical protein [Caulobacteraceae bacterium]